MSEDMAKSKEIWMVQDQNEERTTTNLISRISLATIHVDEEKQKADLYRVIEVMAFAGGIWIFLTQLVFGPIVRALFVNKQLVADLSEREFKKT